MSWAAVWRVWRAFRFFWWAIGGLFALMFARSTKYHIDGQHGLITPLWYALAVAVVVLVTIWIERNRR